MAQDDGSKKATATSRRDGKSRKFKISKKALLIGGTIFVIVLLGVILYGRRARNFVSTDDAYTMAHVHEISSRVPGTVEAVKVNDNQEVKKGQALVALDPRDFKSAVDKARAQLSLRQSASHQAQAGLEGAPGQTNPTSAPNQQNSSAGPKIDPNNAAAAKSARGAASAAKAELTAAETSLSEAERQLSYATIDAPVDGVIGKKTVETGARVQPGQALMAVVERDVWVLANFKETQLAKVRVGQHAEVVIDAVSNHKFSAHVDSLQPGTGSAFALLPPDNATGNFTKIVQRVPVKIVFDDPGEYRPRIVPGLSSRVTIDLHTGQP